MGDLRLRILVSRYQNAFFAELAEIIVDEIRDAGGIADLVKDPVLPEPEDVFLMLTPHEFAALEGSDWAHDPRLTHRIIGITAEQPGTGFFNSNVVLASRLAALFDFSAHAVAAYRRAGIEAHHLPFGWTPSLDRYTAEPTYENDLLFLGCISSRREHALALLARPLWQRKSKLILSDNSAPNWRNSKSFVCGSDKKALLAKTRILLNLHQNTEPYFEWLRVFEAAHCGAVVLSEPSLYQHPFVSGRHLEVAPIPAIPQAIDCLLDSPRRLSDLREAAYELVRERPFARGVERLLSVAEIVRHAAPPPGNALIGPSRTKPMQHAHPQVEQEADADVRAALRELRLDMIDLRREFASSGKSAAELKPIVVANTPTWNDTSRPRVSIITALYNHADYVAEALESAASGSFSDLELVVIDDGSTDGSLEVVRGWIKKTPHVPAVVISHPVNQGLPQARNTALRNARGNLILVLDADNALVPTGLQRMVEKLDAFPDAAFCYGVLQRFNAGGPVGLLGTLPWEPWRLRYSNHIDAMALIRSEVLRRLGGYTTDRRLYGWEDYDLWCRLAEEGGKAVHVPSVVGRYRTSATSMLSLSNLSVKASYDALRERVPRLMAGRMADPNHL